MNRRRALHVWRRRLCAFGPEAAHLPPDELAQLGPLLAGLVEAKRKGLRRLELARVQLCEVARGQRLRHRAALGRVPHEHTAEEVEGVGVRVREDLGPRAAALDGQRLDKLVRLVVCDPLEVLLGGGAEHVDDQPQLVQVVAPFEEGLACNHLCKDAAARPDVDGSGVVLVLDEELRRAVPARDDVLCHALVFLGARVGVDRPRQPKIAYLEVAVLVDKQVAGLEVAVEDVGGVQRVHAAHDLVEEVAKVLVLERLLGVDDVVQVRVHEIADQVHVLPPVLALDRRQDVEDAEYVEVGEVQLDLDLA
mmetsp:Transcript_10237/g.32369  ORF Transcript_10237/g.32369 Transcript_10237/m.32369 type:complete len:307 (-) Transcript_10237:291-1211(-)